ncbi:hypothetical protein ACN28C_07750 [Plantactinospora sp. WMMC1484]|uniref:hypothetical protein n=1 Tax=Plantactinospora sp. WMMC1484 TaxID=3404122 RepID=UPI003BF5BBBD
MRRHTSIVLTGALGMAGALSIATSTATAAPPEAAASTANVAVAAASTANVAVAAASTANVADRLVLEPTNFGYRGSLQAELTYRGSEPGRATYVITEPVPGSYQNLEWGISCYSGGEYLPDGRVRVECDVPGGNLQPGEQRTFSVDFEVLTAVRPFAMKAGNGRLAVEVGGEVVTDETFRTRFRSSTGSLEDPQPYVRDEQPEAGITAGDLTLVRQPDGTFEGRLPLTVRYDGDAPHTGLFLLTSNLPAGVFETYTEPNDGCAHFCVPGGQFMEGEVRSFDLVFAASAQTPLGDLGEAGIEVTTETRQWPPVPDADPSDNLTTFFVTAVEAA